MNERQRERDESWKTKVHQILREEREARNECYYES
jgi:hypothetical protein